MPSSPYVTEMIPSGYSADGNLTFKMTGFFAEVFDNLQVIERSSKKSWQIYVVVYSMII